MKYLLGLLAITLALFIVAPPDVDAAHRHREWKSWTVEQVRKDQTVTYRHYRTADVHGAVNVLYEHHGKLEHIATISLYEGRPFVRWTVNESRIAHHHRLPPKLMYYYF